MSLVRTIDLLRSTCGNFLRSADQLQTDFIFPNLTTLLLDMDCVIGRFSLAKLLPPTLTELTLMLRDNTTDGIFDAIARSPCQLRHLAICGRASFTPFVIHTPAALPPSVRYYSVRNCRLSGPLVHQLALDPHLIALDFTIFASHQQWPQLCRIFFDTPIFPSLTILSVDASTSVDLRYLNDILSHTHLFAQLTTLKISMGGDNDYDSIENILSLVNKCTQLEHLHLSSDPPLYKKDHYFVLNFQVLIGNLLKRDTLTTIILLNLIPERSFWWFLSTHAHHLTHLSVTYSYISPAPTLLQLLSIEHSEFVQLVNGCVALRTLRVCLNTFFSQFQHVPDLHHITHRQTPLTFYPSAEGIFTSNYLAHFLYLYFPHLIIKPRRSLLALTFKDLKTTNWRPRANV